MLIYHQLIYPLDSLVLITPRGLSSQPLINIISYFSQVMCGYLFSKVPGRERTLDCKLYYHPKFHKIGSHIS